MKAFEYSFDSALWLGKDHTLGWSKQYKTMSAAKTAATKERKGLEAIGWVVGETKYREVEKFLFRGQLRR